MTKLDSYQKAKAKWKALMELARRSTDSRWDKFGATVTLSESFMGTYGNSSTTNWTRDDIQAVTTELRKLLNTAIHTAAVTAKSEMDAARIAAQDEAREVLAETEPAATR